MIRIGIIGVAIATALTAYARSETITLACKLASHVDAVAPQTIANTMAVERMIRIDQIFIDTDKPGFELRVANTIGTAHQEVYSAFGTDDTYCRKPQMQEFGDVISGSQLCGAPVGFFL